jgi:amino acid permease
MLKLSPIFGAFWATLIMLLYSSLKSELGINDIGSILKIFPLIFILMIIISYILFIPIKLIFLKQKSKSHFKEMWKVGFVIIFSFSISSILAGLSYYFEDDSIRAIAILFAFSLDMIFSYTFYVSLEKQMAKNDIQK